MRLSRKKAGSHRTATETPGGIRNSAEQSWRKVGQVLASREARAAQIRARSDQLRMESDELASELTSIGEQLTEARRNFALAEDETGSLERDREVLLGET